MPFDPVRLFRWRNYRDYGTGVGGDLFVHLFSGIHFVLGAIGPTRVYTTGGLRFWKDVRCGRTTGLYDYPARGQVPGLQLVTAGGHWWMAPPKTSGFRFVGSEGILTIGTGVTVARQPRESEPGYTIDTSPKPSSRNFCRQYREKYPVQKASADAMRPEGEERYLPPPGYSDSRLDHHRNCIRARARQSAVEDAVFGFRAAGPALLFFEPRLHQRVWSVGSGKHDAEELSAPALIL